jgi:hypothetical protein
METQTYEQQLEHIDRAYYADTAMTLGAMVLFLALGAYALWMLPWRKVEQEQMAEAWNNGRHIPIPPRPSLREMVRAWSR